MPARPPCWVCAIQPATRLRTCSKCEPEYRVRARAAVLCTAAWDATACMRRGPLQGSLCEALAKPPARSGPVRIEAPDRRGQRAAWCRGEAVAGAAALAGRAPD